MANPAGTPNEAPRGPLKPLLLARCLVAGLMMGLANLVPGISGGTMLLAAGVYPRFISAVGEITVLRFRRESLVVLGIIVASAALAILLLAGPVKDLVVHHRWVMYSLFIGLTLGGIPVVWRLIGRATGSLWAGAAAGFAVMVLVAVIQAGGAESGADRGGFLFLLLAGAAGASAMILPGISGGYVLLLMDVYVPILAAIAEFLQALRAVDLPRLMAVSLSTILPVGLGVLIGALALTNLLRILLARHEKPTLGVLLGLLIGAVVGLWPFQASVPPQAGDILKGQVLVQDQDGGLRYQVTGKTVRVEEYPTAAFSPQRAQVAGALGLIAAGFVITTLVGRLGQHGEGDGA